MLFHSFEFLIFAALFFLGWPLLRRTSNGRWAYLTLASFLFYGWWDWRFLGLLVASGLVDFWAALGIVRFHKYRRLVLGVSMAANIGALAVFKYLDFFISNVNNVLAASGFDGHVPLLNVILPVGISFYTFQSMSYTIDVYRGELRPTRNVLHFFAYLSLFPQLVAGPIVRAADLLPQLESYRSTTESDRWEGLRLIVHGFFKKMVIADSLAVPVNEAFGASSPVESAIYWWVITAMFALQIYCDFSGYSDIARGLARWMGYEFPVNFEHPYIAASLREFWGRWHISLSTWFRDYVYIPLGGSRMGAVAGHRNMWVAMLVSGLWHGASWNFVLWGALHAAWLSLERITRLPERLERLPAGRVAGTGLTLCLVLISWVFFRAETFGQATGILAIMFSPSAWPATSTLNLIGKQALLLGALMAARELYFFLGLNQKWTLPERPVTVLQPLATACIIVACVFLRGPGDTFIYFQF